MARKLEGDFCIMPGCGKLRKKLQDGRSRFCSMHQARQLKYGDPTCVAWHGWKPNRLLRSKYRHTRGGSESYEHREIWTQANGPIPAGHVVHHADGNSLNNRLENLELMSNSEHTRYHKRGD